MNNDITNIEIGPIISDNDLLKENLIRLIKAEAKVRINSFFPSHKQANYPRNSGEKVQEWARVDAIRAASNNFEKSLEKLKTLDIGEAQIHDWHGWPK